MLTTRSLPYGGGGGSLTEPPGQRAPEQRAPGQRPPQVRQEVTSYRDTPV